MSTPAQVRLHAMVVAEAEAAPAVTRPDYDLLAHLADAWYELQADFVSIGGGSATVRALVAGLRDPWALDALAGLAIRPQNDLLLREAAAWALGRMPGQPAEEALLQVIESSGPVRTTALRAIARRDSAWGRAVLDLELDPDGLDPVGGAIALAEHGHIDAVRLLLEALRDEADPRAAEALARLGVRAAAPALEAMVRSPDDGLREAAVQALGELGCPRTWPSLIGSVDDPQEDVSTAAWQALERASGLSPRELLTLEHRGRFTAVAQGWWQAHREAFDGELRYRHGRPWTPAAALDELAAARLARLQPELLYGVQCAVEVAVGERFGLDPFELRPSLFEAGLLAARQAAAQTVVAPGRWRWWGEAVDDPPRWPW